MVGQVLGAVGALPDIYIELEISYFLLRRLLGVRTEGDKKGAKVPVWVSHCAVLYISSVHCSVPDLFIFFCWFPPALLT